MTLAHPNRPADRIALFLNALVKAVADSFPKGQEGQLLLWQRLMRLAARFTAILTKPRRPRPQNPPSRPADKPRSGPNPKPPPNDFGILFRQLPGYERHRTQFEQMLQQPDIAELLQATPELRRVLNPLCRMLRLKPVPAPIPAPQAQGPEPANSSASRQAQAARQLTPGLFASPARTEKAPRACGPPPPSLWSVILRELDRRKNRAAKAEPVPTG
jgi:hypothetical protein